MDCTPVFFHTSDYCEHPLSEKFHGKSVQRYHLNVTTDETGQTHKIDPNSVSVTSPYSAEMAQKNKFQLRNTPESYQSDSMVTVTDFPNFTIQGYENAPITRCSISTQNGNG